MKALHKTERLYCSNTDIPDNFDAFFVISGKVTTCLLVYLSTF